MRWWEWWHHHRAPGDVLEYPGAGAPRPMFELELERPIGFTTRWGRPPGARTRAP